MTGRIVEDRAQPFRLVRAGELLAGALALALPLATSIRPWPFAVAGAIALALVALRRTRAARTGVGAAVVASAFAFPVSAALGTLPLLTADAVALLAYLTLGAWVEAAGSSPVPQHLRRQLGARLLVGAGVVALVSVVSATTMHLRYAGLWLALAGMAAAVGAVLLARGAARGD